MARRRHSLITHTSFINIALSELFWQGYCYSLLVSESLLFVTSCLSGVSGAVRII